MTEFSIGCQPKNLLDNTYIGEKTQTNSKNIMVLQKYSNTTFLVSQEVFCIFAEVGIWEQSPKTKIPQVWGTLRNATSCKLAWLLISNYFMEK